MSDSYGVGGGLIVLFVFSLLIGALLLAAVLFLVHHLHFSMGWTP